MIAVTALIVTLSTFAQSDVNRLIINDKTGNWKAFALDKVDYAEFANVDGDVRADVVVSEVALDKIILSVTRTEACQGFKLSCVPTVQISNYSDDYLAQYIDRDNDIIFVDDMPLKYDNFDKNVISVLIGYNITSTVISTLATVMFVVFLPAEWVNLVSTIVVAVFCYVFSILIITFGFVIVLIKNSSLNELKVSDIDLSKYVDDEKVCNSVFCVFPAFCGSTEWCCGHA